MQVLDADNLAANATAAAGDDHGHAVRRPRTVTVLALLSLTALVFSYLGAYALAGTLASAGVIPAWSPEEDPRPRNMMVGFLALLVFFVASAGVFRLLSHRQLRRIDAMAEEGAG